METVTVLVTDLVESTRLAARLGPDAADELLRAHFATLREAISAAGGHEIKTTGDGLMVVFPGAAGAVSCAVAAQQAIERGNRAGGERLAMRVGLALGDVAGEGGDVFGLPVVEAVRLCDAAAGGQILATDLVRIIGGRGGHPFRAVGPLELRGLPEPVAAFEIGWEPDSGWGKEIPLPPRLPAAPADGYVGRERERERVGARWDAARAGACQALLVAGEPGIGKTRFTTHAALECRADGAVVLFGHCAEEVGAPYGPWLEALGHLVGHAPQEALEHHVERCGGELARLVPAIARRVPDAPAPARTDPETERYLLFSAVVSLLEEASAECPLVLVLDDLHWADAPTLALLKHVLCEAQGARVLVLASYRDSDLVRGHPLTEVLADLRRVEGIERLALEGLGADAVVALMELAAGHPLDADGLALAREITAETGGNPFYVGELLRHLSESGALVRAADGRWELVPCLGDLGLPQSVREVVHRRVERLGEDCSRALTAAAVIGRDFDLALLAAVVRREDDELLDLLDAAAEASLLVERAERPGAFSFAHNLINHTLYDGLGAARRARLHRRVAEALEGLCGEDPGPRVAELARHWTAATAPIDPGKALGYSRRAGERALAELAPGEAARWFAQALELLGRAGGDGDAAERCELLIGLGEAQRQTGRPAFRETLLDASGLAERLGDGDRAARAALANSRGFASRFGAVDAERVAALERALALNRDAEPARRARLLALQAMELQYDPDHERRRALADEALAAARSAGDPRVLPYVLRDHFHAVWSADTLAERRRTAVEMTALAARLDDPLARIWALDRTVHAAAEAGALGEAAAASSRLVAHTEELGQPGLRWHATYYAAGLAQLRGDLGEVERLAEAARALGERAGEPDAVVVYLGQICTVRAEQGRGEEIVALLEQAVAATPGIPAFEAGLATVLCDVGRAADAAPRLERAARRGFAAIPRDPVCSTALTTWARAAADLGAERAAGPLYDLLAPWRDLLVWNGAQGYGAVASYLGMLAATLGAHDRAAEHFAAASEIHRREGIVGWETRNLVYGARSRAATGDAEAARALAERALGMARAGASPACARHAEALLHATAGVPARR